MLNFFFFQLARIHLHGFSEREISIVRALLLSGIESAYLERDQIQSTSLRDEYVQVSLYTQYFFCKMFSRCLWKGKLLLRLILPLPFFLSLSALSLQ